MFSQVTGHAMCVTQPTVGSGVDASCAVHRSTHWRSEGSSWQHPNRSWRMQGLSQLTCSPLTNEGIISLIKTICCHHAGNIRCPWRKEEAESTAFDYQFPTAAEFHWIDSAVRNIWLLHRLITVALSFLIQWVNVWISLWLHVWWEGCAEFGG